MHGAMDTGRQRAKLPVGDYPISLTGNYTYNSPVVNGKTKFMREFFFSNDSSANATLQFNDPMNISIIIYAGETFDERIGEFSQVTITAVGAWRAYPRSGEVD